MVLPGRLGRGEVPWAVGPGEEPRCAGERLPLALERTSLGQGRLEARCGSPGQAPRQPGTARKLGCGFRAWWTEFQPQLSPFPAGPPPTSCFPSLSLRFWSGQSWRFPTRTQGCSPSRRPSSASRPWGRGTTDLVWGALVVVWAPCLQEAEEGTLGLSSPGSQGREPGLGAINSRRRVELPPVPTLLRMSQPGPAWAGARRSQGAGQRPEARPSAAGPSLRRPRQAAWEGAGLPERLWARSPSDVDVTPVCPQQPSEARQQQSSFISGETEAQRGPWPGMT